MTDINESTSRPDFRRHAETLSSSLVGVILSAFLGGISAAALLLGLEHAIVGEALSTNARLQRIEAALTSLAASFETERASADARQRQLIQEHSFLKANLGQLARSDIVNQINGRVLAIDTAVAQHPSLLENVVNTLDGSIAQHHNDSDHITRASQQETIEQLRAEAGALATAIQAIHDNQNEARLALATEIGQLETTGEELINSDPHSPVAVSQWLDEARLVVLSLNLFTQDGYFRQYSAAQREIDAAAREFDRTGDLGHAKSALVVIKAIHRLARGGHVPVNND